MPVFFWCAQHGQQLGGEEVDKLIIYLLLDCVPGTHLFAFPAGTSFETWNFKRRFRKWFKEVSK